MFIFRQQTVRLDDERYEEIKAEVIDMYEECDLHNFPLDAFAIAETLHYKVTPYSKLSQEKLKECLSLTEDGCSELVLNPETGIYEYHIYYNDLNGMNAGRIQFTVMHEIGHIRLGHLDDDFDKSDTIKEAEANFYAAYSIAPPPMVDQYECETPEEVCERFNTSYEMGYNALVRCQKWLRHSKFYEDYEVHMLGLFENKDHQLAI